MAAGVSDGAVIIDTKLDSSGFIRDAKKFNSAIQGLQTSVNRIGKALAQSSAGYISSVKRQASTARDFGNELKSLENDAAALREALDTLGNARVPTKAFTEARAELKKLYAQLETLYSRRDKMDYLKVSPDAQSYRSVVYDIENVEAKIRDLRSTISEMKADGGGAYVLGNQTERYQQLSQQLETVTSRIQELREAEQSAQTASEGVSSGFESIRGAAGRALESVRRFAGNTASTFLKKLAAGARNAVAQLAKLATRAKNAAVQLAKLAANAVRSGLSKLGGMIASTAKSMLGLNRNTRQAGNGFNVGFRNILKYGLGIRSLFVLFNRLRTAIKEAFTALSEQSPEVNASLSSLKASLNGLKGSLASAFSPILTAITPALTTLINMLTKAMNTLGAFMAALTGQSYYYAATGISEVGSAASSASSSVSELKKQLTGFDDLNVLSKTSSSGSGSGSGSSSGVSYEQTEIEGGINDFVSKLKELWETADYEGIGRIIANGINAAFTRAKELISWDNLGDRITEAVNAITGIFNGLVDNIDWDLIGRTFATGINTLVNTANLLLTGIDWANLGTKIAEGLSGLVDEIDWTTLGDTLGQYVRAWILSIGSIVSNFNWSSLGTNLATGFNSFISVVKDTLNKLDWKSIGTNIGTGFSNMITGVDWGNVAQTLSTYVKNAFTGISSAIAAVDWHQIGEDVKTFLVNIDWSGIFTSASEALGAAFGGLAGFLAGLFNTAFTNIAEYFDNSIEAAGGDVVAGIFNGIVNALKSIGSWIKTNIFDPFIKGFKEAFGISSPASTMEGPGENIVKGIFTGITNALKNVGTWVKNNIFQPIWDAISAVGTTAINITVSLVKKVGEWAEDAWTAISAVGTQTINRVVTLAKKVGSWVEDAWTAINTTGTETINRVVTLAKKVGSWAEEAWTAISTFGTETINRVVTLAKKAGSWVDDAWTAVSSIGTETINRVVTLAKKVGSWADEAWTAISTFGTETINRVVTLAKKVGGWVEDAWTAINTTGTETINRVVTLAKKVGSWAEDAWTAISTFGTETINRVVTLAKKVGSWVEDAWTAITTTGTATINRVVTLAKKAGSWVADAWTAVSDTAARTIGRTVELLRSKTNWDSAVWNFATSVGTIIRDISVTITEKVSEWFKKFFNWINGGGTNEPIEVPVGCYLEDGEIKAFAEEITTGWDGLPSDLKTVDIETDFDWSGWDEEWKKLDKRDRTVEVIGNVVKGWAGTIQDWFNWVNGNLSGDPSVDMKANLSSQGKEWAENLQGWFNKLLAGSKNTTPGVDLKGNLNKGKNMSTGSIYSWIGAKKGVLSFTISLVGKAWENLIKFLKQLAGVKNSNNSGEDFAEALSDSLGSSEAYEAIQDYADNVGEAVQARLDNVSLNTSIINDSDLGVLNEAANVICNAPILSTGAVMPYEISEQIAKSSAEIQTTLDANNEDLIQTIISVAGQIVAALNGTQNSNGASKLPGLTTQQVINEINRQTQVYGKSPLVGV